MSAEILLWSGYLLVAISLAFFAKEKYQAAIAFLVLSALAFFSSATGWYPYLNGWDERFHALVAKNLMHHPFKPTLFDEKVVSTNYNHWTNFNIWLHKQPGFLWQIMLSYFLFGVNEFALRFPSALAYTFLTFALFRSGKLLINTRVGYYAAFLFLSSLYFAEMVAGYEQLDHHDVMSITYVGLSVWAWLEYLKKPNLSWLLLIGLFTGMAVLNKWLVGLVVFLMWGLYILLQQPRSWRKFSAFFTALIITALIALPWQIFIYSRYPQEANDASHFFIEHFFTPLEYHTGSFWYHVQLLPRHFGAGAQLLVVPAFYYLGKRLQYSPLYWSMVGAVVFIYAFFGLAATKMPAFTAVAALPILLALAVLLYEGEVFLQRKYADRSWLKVLFPIALLLFFMYRFQFTKIYQEHPIAGATNSCQERLTNNQKLFRALNLPQNAVLFNLQGKHYVEAMFYTGAIAYNFIPSEAQLKEALAKGKKVFVFQGAQQLPPYLGDNAQVHVLAKSPETCE